MSPRLPLVIGISIAVLALASFASRGDTPAAKSPTPANAATSPTTTDWPPKIKRVLPPIAPPLDEADMKKAIAARAELKAALDRPELKTAELRPDVEIFHKAIDFAIRHNEFFDPKSDRTRVGALHLLGLQRAEALAAGKSPWSAAHGTLVRGFRSKIDDSVQPYGLYIPEQLDLSKPVPLYVWLHGRGDKQCDLQFISQFLDPKKKPGPLLPENAIVLHPFGRYCNGFKSAGETDVLEAIAAVQERYKIDEERIVMAGFSMGGAGAWHLGAHYPDRWCAVHAGAGFVDVRRYQNITADKMPPPYVQTLWGLYDVPDYRRNLLDVPLIAYSGADDKQKQAADIMEAELAREGFQLTHIIGPGVAHKYEPKALAEVQRRLAELVAKGRDPKPRKSSFQTKTLRYCSNGDVVAEKLERHWDDSRIDLERVGTGAVLKTKNIVSFVLIGEYPAVEIDGQNVALKIAPASWGRFTKANGTWQHIKNGPYLHLDGLPGKTVGFQGPIDDAFVSRFTVVLPNAVANAGAIDRWVDFESNHFLERWSQLMRGDARRARSADTRYIDATENNIILWGTPQSNPLIAHCVDKLPIRWTEKIVGIGDLEFDATKVVPVLIYPNPTGRKYVVINSGLTFREGHDGTNSQQNPKLPDWAMIDITQPPSELYPGKVVAAGFFDEEWKFDPTRTYKAGDIK